MSLQRLQTVHPAPATAEEETKPLHVVVLHSGGVVHNIYFVLYTALCPFYLTLTTETCTLHCNTLFIFHTATLILHTAHFTMHTVYCTLYTVYCTLYTAHCTQHTCYLCHRGVVDPSSPKLHPLADSSPQQHNQGKQHPAGETLSVLANTRIEPNLTYLGYFFISVDYFSDFYVSLVFVWWEGCQHLSDL